MCFYVDLQFKAVELENRFDATIEFVEDMLLEKEVKGFSFPETPVIVDESPKVITPYYWGLIPFWSKDNNIQKYTLNAKIETLSEKPSFRQSVNKRCLVLVNGFYEWKWLDAKGKQKEKYRIYTPDNEPFALAGIYSKWNDPNSGQEVKTYSIITTEANKLMAEIHNTKKRMPVVLQKGDEASWLQHEDYNFYKYPGYESKLDAEIVSPGQAQGSLF